MKTIVHDPRGLEDPLITYPCLFKKDDDIALAWSEVDGYIIHNPDGCWMPSRRLQMGGTSWINAGWKPVFKPTTITFTP